MHADFDIVLMERVHLDQVLAIERASHPNPWSEPAFVHEIESNPAGRSRVAVRSGSSVVGYAVCWILFEELHIQNVTVHPSHRRSGIAKALLRDAFEGALERNASIALLEVRRSNEAARRLYRALGFVEDGARASYYTQPAEDALLFRRELARVGKR